MSTHFNPEIYVVCLASYKARDIHGCMIDATLPYEENRRKINNMLMDSPYYEGQKKWFILGYEGFADICIDKYMGENADFLPIYTLATAIKKNKDMVIAALRYYRYDVDYLIIALEEKYRGEWDSELSFTKSLLEHEARERYNALDYQDRPFCWDEPNREDMECIIDRLFRHDYPPSAEDTFETFASLTVGNKIHIFSRLSRY